MLRTRLIAGTTAGFVLSAVFATLMTVVNVVETLIEPLRVDPDHPAPVTLRLPPTTLRVSDDERGLVLETVSPTIGRGEVVGDRVTASIVRMHERGRRPPSAGSLIGLWFVYFLVATMVTAYLRGFTPGRGALLRTQAGLLGLGVVLLVAAKGFLLLTDLPLYVIPVGALGLWAALYLDRRTAFMVAVATAFLTASLVGFRMTAITVYLVSGVAAVAVFRDRKHSVSMVLAGLVAGIAAGATLVASKMIFEGGYDFYEDLQDGLYSDLLASAAGGLIGGVVGFVLQGLAVVALGAVSRQKLMDLTDLDHPLLQKMAREAPGSWEHSRAMANLAEAAAAAIGADSLLTRVGAYYHDLGKTVQAKYFVENLEGGETSPHTELDPDVSADAIMAHVVEGTKILRDGGIPEPVVEFAYTHHGTSVIEYFWHKCLEQGNPKNRKESFFRYPGMRPRTKETAILMLIDSIEAAARTIDPPSKEAFDQMVQRIIFVKLKQGQLDESGLTMTDLRTLGTKLVDTLTSVHHKRIKYPWQERKEKGEKELPIPGVATEKDIARQRAASEAEERAARERNREAAETAPEPPTVGDGRAASETSETQPESAPPPAPGVGSEPPAGNGADRIESYDSIPAAPGVARDPEAAAAAGAAFVEDLASEPPPPPGEERERATRSAFGGDQPTESAIVAGGPAPEDGAAPSTKPTERRKVQADEADPSEAHPNEAHPDGGHPNPAPEDR